MLAHKITSPDDFEDIEGKRALPETLDLDKKLKTNSQKNRTLNNIDVATPDKTFTRARAWGGGTRANRCL